MNLNYCDMCCPHTGNPGAQFLDPARVGDPPPPLGGGPKVFPAKIFGQKMEVDVERIGFSAAEGGQKKIETIVYTKKKS